MGVRSVKEIKTNTGRNACAPRRLFNLAHTNRVGQVGNLRRIGNPPGVGSGITYGPITNRSQVTNLPHTISTAQCQASTL